MSTDTHKNDNGERGMEEEQTTSTTEVISSRRLRMLMGGHRVGYRITKDRLSKVIITVIAFLSTLPLLFILFYIVKNGIAAINWGFVTNLPKPVGEPHSGIANAIVGTGIIVAIACVISVPIGILAGIYLSEKREGKLAAASRLCVDSLQGVPSIVIGIIAYAWLVVPLGGFSALSGGVALAIMMLPVVVRTAEETLRLIPDYLKEASLALGVPYHKTIIKVILPTAMSGIVTGVLLGIARIAGETAPLLFTAFGNPFMNTNIAKPTASLPLVIFNYATSPFPELHTLAWGASFVLVVFVLIVNLTAKVVMKKWTYRF